MLLIQMINDYHTPEEKIFSRGLEAELDLAEEYLRKCRPLAVSMTNALKYIKLSISQETNSLGTDSEVIHFRFFYQLFVIEY